MDNFPKIYTIRRDNFNEIISHYSRTTELNFDVRIIVNTNTTIITISKQIYAWITAQINKGTYIRC